MTRFSADLGRLAGTLLLGTCLACAPSTSGPELTKLVITGSSTVAPLMSEIAKRYESENPNVRIDVQTGGSSRGIADARSGAADLGMISRDLKDDERDLLAVTVARDGVSLILHADNPLPSLSSEQVRGIFRGEITSWAEIGGPELDVTVVNKAEGRATLEVFKDYFGLESPEIKADVIIGHNEQGVKTVAGNPGAVGYVSIGVAEADVAAGIAVRLPKIDGATPSTAAVADGTFPIARPLNLVHGAELDEAATRFIDYCRSDAVHDLIAAQRFVSVFASSTESR